MPKDTCVLTKGSPSEMLKQLKENAQDIAEVVGNSFKHGAETALETTAKTYEGSGDAIGSMAAGALHGAGATVKKSYQEAKRIHQKYQ